MTIEKGWIFSVYFFNFMWMKLFRYNRIGMLFAVLCSLSLHAGGEEASGKSQHGREWSWFPSEQARMGRMIAQLDQLGSIAIKEHALFKNIPVAGWVQDMKSSVAEEGFYYVFHTAYSMASLDNRVEGMQALEQFFTSSFAFRWNVLSGGEQVGTWINFQTDSSYAVGQKNPGKLPLQNGLGTATNPNSGISYPNGAYVKEVAIAQSFLRGDAVLIFGMVNDTNYFDVNRYAGTQYGMFMNGAFCNGMVIPAVASNLGIILQYQLNDNLYIMFRTGANNAQTGDNPFRHLSWDNMSYMGEIGWSHKNALGTGYGEYKLQPFIATVEGKTQPGIAFNASQDLGTSPFSLFARAGIGGDRVTALRGASKQVSGGLVIKRPLELLGWVEEDSSNFFGVAAVWSETPDTASRAGGREETALEFNYSIQLTPTMILQPNYQMYFDPAYSDRSFASVFQIQLSINW